MVPDGILDERSIFLSSSESKSSFCNRKKNSILSYEIKSINILDLVAIKSTINATIKYLKIPLPCAIIKLS